MTDLRALASRPWLAGVLALVLFLAGVGRGWSATPGGFEGGPVIAGVVAPICHGAGGDSAPAAPNHDACCDACALCAPATLPGMPDLTAPARVVHLATHEAASSWRPRAGRWRTPQLARAPPRRA